MNAVRWSKQKVTWQRHANRSLLVLLSDKLASVFPHARISLYQPIRSPLLPVIPFPAAKLTAPPPRTARIIPFPHPPQPSYAESRLPLPFLLPHNPLPASKVPNLARSQPQQVGLR